MTPEKRIFQPVTSSDVCRIYELLHKQNFVSFHLTSDGRHKVDALVASITGSYFGLDTLAIFIEKIHEKDHQKVIKTLSNLVFANHKSA